MNDGGESPTVATCNLTQRGRHAGVIFEVDGYELGQRPEQLGSVVIKANNLVLARESVRRGAPNETIASGDDDDRHGNGGCKARSTGSALGRPIPRARR